jgi:3-deoxy-D-manno-octulosonic-acid transferase
MHAPSVGEGLQAAPVLARLRAARPDVQLVYTYFSPSAVRFAEGLPVDHRGALPFDTVGAARQLLDALAPTALVFAKLDLWPVLVEQAAARGVRTGVISATLAADSGRQGALARALLRDAYAALDAVGAIDADDAARLVALGVRADRVTVTGDTRYDQVAARAAAITDAETVLGPLRSARPTLVAGSTWPTDEAVLRPALARWRATAPTARVVMAPHEPTERHLSDIERWAAADGWRAARLGALAPEGAAAVDLLLVDRVGVLGALYALADVAYVGGGFHAAGLHSVLEPAAFGVPVLFGPGGARVRDARALVAAGGGRAVDDAASLGVALLDWSADAEARRAAGARAAATVAREVGAADRATALVTRLLEGAGAPAPTSRPAPRS